MVSGRDGSRDGGRGRGRGVGGRKLKSGSGRNLRIPTSEVVDDKGLLCGRKLLQLGAKWRRQRQAVKDEGGGHRADKRVSKDRGSEVEMGQNAGSGNEEPEAPLGEGDRRSEREPLLVRNTDYSKVESCGGSPKIDSLALLGSYKSDDSDHSTPPGVVAAPPPDTSHPPHNYGPVHHASSSGGVQSHPHGSSLVHPHGYASYGGVQSHPHGSSLAPPPHGYASSGVPPHGYASSGGVQSHPHGSSLVHPGQEYPQYNTGPPFQHVRTSFLPPMGFPPNSAFGSLGTSSYGSDATPYWPIGNSGIGAPPSFYQGRAPPSIAPPSPAPPSFYQGIHGSSERAPTSIVPPSFYQGSAPPSFYQDRYDPFSRRGRDSGSGMPPHDGQIGSPSGQGGDSLILENFSQSHSKQLKDDAISPSQFHASLSYPIASLHRAKGQVAEKFVAKVHAQLLNHRFHTPTFVVPETSNLFEAKLIVLVASLRGIPVLFFPDQHIE